MASRARLFISKYCRSIGVERGGGELTVLASRGEMNADVVAGTLHAASDPGNCDAISSLLPTAAGKVPATLRVTAARGHLLRHRSSPRRHGVAVVVLPRIWPRGARNAIHTISQQPAS